MRFGISATSLICPKNLRTRLRPVNVCCAIVASRYRLVIDAPVRAHPSRRPLPGLLGSNLHSSRGPEDRFVLPTLKPQNNALRDRKGRSSRQNHLITDCKSPKLPILPTAYRGKRRRPLTARRPF